MSSAGDRVAASVALALLIALIACTQPTTPFAPATLPDGWSWIPDEALVRDFNAAEVGSVASYAGGKAVVLDRFGAARAEPDMIILAFAYQIPEGTTGAFDRDIARNAAARAAITPAIGLLRAPYYPIETIPFSVGEVGQVGRYTVRQVGRYTVPGVSGAVGMFRRANTGVVIGIQVHHDRGVDADELQVLVDWAGEIDQRYAGDGGGSAPPTGVAEIGPTPVF